MNWHIGQKVVCIETPNPLLFDPSATTCVTFKKGDTLTINSINLDYDGACWLGFIEAEQDQEYDSAIFRPIESTYTEEEIESVNIDELVQPELEPA